ncbi:MAG: hypothetical protein K0S24_1706 [Sphingobacterium sp.]|jgi:AraC-like DNA-binding protein|nr:hypothetical protein [Sphingobacterium sp.]
MQKSLFIALEEHYTPISSTVALNHILGVQLMKIAKPSYFQNENGDEALLQEFDGFLSYLTSLHLFGQKRSPIRLQIEREDLHAFYVLESAGPILLVKDHQQFELHPKRGCYCYLPPGEYILEFPEGRTQLFSFYFRGKMFRKNHERHFKFLQELVEAFRNKTGLVVQSVDFWIGPRTRVLIARLLEHLQFIDLDIELFLHRQILELLKLSKEKIFEEYEKVYDGSILALQVREEIRRSIAVDGQDFRLNELPALFKKSQQYLGRVYKAVFGHSLTQCRKYFLLELAQENLLKLSNSTQAAYACGFNSVQQFDKFFKNASGMTPTDYLNKIRGE